MGKVLVFITKCNHKKVAVWFDDENEAKAYLVDTYRREIKIVPYYDYKESYITENGEYAQIAAGIYSTKIYLCNEFKYKSKYRKIK